MQAIRRCVRSLNLVYRLPGRFVTHRNVGFIKQEQTAKQDPEPAWMKFFGGIQELEIDLD